MPQRLSIDDPLHAVLAAHLGEPPRFAVNPAPLAGGFWASIHRFELEGAPPPFAGPLVVRVMPERAVGIRETIVQQTLAAQGFPTPSVLLSGVDDALGGPFMVMPFVEGTALLSGLALGPSLWRVPGILRRLPGQLADTTLGLHALDPGPLQCALEQAGVAVGMRAATTQLNDVAAAARTGARGFSEVSDWLDERLCETAIADVERVVCHGDLHPFNLMHDGRDGITVLDWTNARIMPREMDVGLTAALLRCAPLDAPGFVRPAITRLSHRLANRFVEAYATQVPLDLQLVEAFEAMQYARCLAEVLSARRGESDVVGPRHPFETSASAMIDALAGITSITVTLPVRPPVPAS
jgi:aminoglycoside phosphotransferase (APT) family kinase protein